MTSIEERLIRQESYYDTPYHWCTQKNVRALYDLRTRLALNQIDSPTDKRLLDFGCGDGRFSAALVCADVGRTIGVDISDRALSFARCLVPEAEFYQIQDSHLPFESGVFNAIFALDVIEHIPDDEIAGWTREINRVLHPGGKLIVSVPSQLIPLQAYSFGMIEIEGYMRKPRWLPYQLFRFYNLDGLWKLYRGLVKSCSPRQAAYLMAGAIKQGDAKPHR